MQVKRQRREEGLRHEPDQRPAGPFREDESQQSARHGKQQAFREQLASESPAACAERDPHAHFMAPRSGTREHQVCEVHAGDEQDQAHDTHEHIKRPRKVRTHLGIHSVRCRRNLETHREKLLAALAHVNRRQCGRENTGPECLQLGASLLDGNSVSQSAHQLQPEK